MPTALAQAAPVSLGSPLFARAREIDARLRSRNTTRNRTYAEDAFDLLECRRLELFRLLGYSSVTAYAYSVNGFGSSKTSALIQIAEACEVLPRIREAFLKGDLGCSAAEQIVKKATPEDEEEWLRKAKVLKVEELKALVREEDPVYWRRLGFSQEGLAWAEAAVDAIRKELGPLSFGMAVGEACRRLLEGGSGTPNRSSFRVVIHRCGECDQATRHTSEGPVAVRPEEVERIACDAELLDIRNGPAKLTRTPPPRIRNYVLGRDGGRCVVPGCGNRLVQFHHEDGWENGHDPSRCFGLCDAHHQARHRGYLRIEGSMPEVTFFLADGTCLGRAGDARKATEPAPAPEGPSAHAESAPSSSAAPAADSAHAESISPPSTAPLLPNPVEDATRALIKLQLPKSEATAAVRSVVQRHPGRSWEAGELVQAVLRSRPSRG